MEHKLTSVELNRVRSMAYKLPLFTFIENQIKTTLIPLTLLDPKEPVVAVWKKIALINFIDFIMSLPYAEYRDAFDTVQIQDQEKAPLRKLTDYLNQTIVPLRAVLESECGAYLDDEELRGLPLTLPLPALDSESLRTIQISAVCGPSYNLAIFDDMLKLFNFAAMDVYKATQLKLKDKRSEHSTILADLQLCPEIKILTINIEDKSVESAKQIFDFVQVLELQINILADFLNLMINKINNDLASIQHKTKLKQLPKQAARKYENDCAETVVELRFKINRIVEGLKNNLDILNSPIKPNNKFEVIQQQKNKLQIFYDQINQHVFLMLQVDDDHRGISHLQAMLLKIVGNDTPFKKFFIIFSEEVNQKKIKLTKHANKLKKEIEFLQSNLENVGPQIKAAVGGEHPSAKGKPKQKESKGAGAPSLQLIHLHAWDKEYHATIIPKKLRAYSEACMRELKENPTVLEDCLSSLFSFVTYQASSQLADQLSLAAISVMLIQDAVPTHKPRFYPVHIIGEYLDNDKQSYLMNAAQLIVGFFYPELTEKNLIESMRNYIIHSTDTAERYGKSYTTDEIKSTTHHFHAAVQLHFDKKMGDFKEGSGKEFVAFAQRSAAWARVFTKPKKEDVPHLIDTAFNLTVACLKILDEHKIELKPFSPIFFLGENQTIPHHFKELDSHLKAIGQLLNQISGFGSGGKYNMLMGKGMCFRMYRNNHAHSNHFLPHEQVECLRVIADNSFSTELDKLRKGTDPSIVPAAVI